MKWRNSKERELLASGGSRDQTLPNKNNPNPDLSDVKCDQPMPLHSPIPASPHNNSMSPTNSQNEILYDSKSSHQSPQCQKSQQNYPSNITSSALMHISNTSTAAAMVELRMTSNQVQQRASPPHMVAVAKSNVNASDVSTLSISIMRSINSITTSSTSTSSSTASSPNIAFVNLQSKLTCETQNHIAADDLKFKLETNFNDTERSHLRILASPVDHCMMSATSADSSLLINSQITAACLQNRDASNHQVLVATDAQNCLQINNRNKQLQTHISPHVLAHAHLKFKHNNMTQSYHNDKEDTNTESDEEISVT